MSDKKWLNLVIFLISVMIILFLILQKNLNRDPPSRFKIQALVPQSFTTTLLRVNNRWIPIEQITTEIGQQRWLDFENAWKTLVADSISSNPSKRSADELELTLVWVAEKQKLSYKVFASEQGLTVQSLGANSANYHYPVTSAKQLLPVWLVKKTNTSAR